MKKAKLCVVGLGYIGLPTSAMFAAHGHEVVGVDVNQKVIEALNEGRIIIEEPGLEDLVKKVVESGNLKAQAAPCEADAFIIAVPTPITADRKADMKYVEAATRAIVPYVKKGDIVILESTSPTGTTEELMRPILEETGLRAGIDFYLGHSPERVLPGLILHELINNNRIIGGVNSKSAEAIRDLYASFVKGEMLLTTSTTAEMCKMMENTYRDVNIALANELAKICERIGINAWEVISLCNKHPRVNIHQPGPGVGGHCLAVDPYFIIEKTPDLAKIIELSRETNCSMPHYVADRIGELVKGVEKKKVTVLGITYKPNIDDMRESPIVELMDILEEQGYEVTAVDPYVESFKQKVANPVKACEKSDLVLLAVNHDDFKKLPLKEMAAAMRGNALLDTRNFISAQEAEKAGFKYSLLGKSEDLADKFLAEVAATASGK
jgi:UDP-N-acetyl-D-mannosaminuronic acid dehydrogenase